MLLPLQWYHCFPRKLDIPSSGPADCQQMDSQHFLFFVILASDPVSKIGASDLPGLMHIKPVSGISCFTSRQWALKM